MKQALLSNKQRICLRLLTIIRRERNQSRILIPKQFKTSEICKNRHITLMKHCDLAMKKKHTRSINLMEAFLHIFLHKSSAGSKNNTSRELLFSKICRNTSIRLMDLVCFTYNFNMVSVSGFLFLGLYWLAYFLLFHWVLVGAPNSLFNFFFSHLILIPLETTVVAPPTSDSTVIDYNHPLYLHPFDAPSTILVSHQLTGFENYSIWSRSIRITFLAKNKLEFLDRDCKKVNFADHLHSQWDRCNAITFSWMLNTVSSDTMLKW